LQSKKTNKQSTVRKKRQSFCAGRRGVERDKERGGHERGPGKETAQRGCLAAGRARAAAKDFSRRCVCIHPLPPFPHPKYLDDGDVQKRAPEAHGEGRGRHHGRPGQEAHGHGERRHLVPARDDPRLQRHEQPCT